VKTITQYREEIKALRKAAGDISAKATIENRDPSMDEVSLKNEIMDKVEELERIVLAQEREERIIARLEAPSNPPLTKPGQQNPKIDDRPKDRFGTFGEQLAAVMQACKPGGIVDNRLRNFRAAASGMNETVPSEGGLR